MRVLYVEDNEVNQALVARVMRARQWKVFFREEGEGALDVLASDPEIDLVLLDIELAGKMSGLDVIRTLRARNDRRPVVAITAYAMMGDRERILEAGCDQYLPKPLVIPDLLNLMDEYEQEFKQQASTPAPAESVAADKTPPSEPAQPAQTAAEKPATQPAEPAQTPAETPAAKPAASSTAPAADAAKSGATPPEDAASRAAADNETTASGSDTASTEARPGETTGASAEQQTSDTANPTANTTAPNATPGAPSTPPTVAPAAASQAVSTASEPAEDSANE